MAFHVQHFFLFFLLWKNSFCKDVSLEQNGFEGVTIFISPNVPESDWNQLVENIKQAFADGSTSLYYGSNSRAYFRDIQIVLPMSWGRHGHPRTFSSMMADITIDNAPTSLYGRMPYNEQARICNVEGDRINFPISFFENLQNTMDRIGPLGSLILKQWMSYRYGIFEEVGFPLDTVYPSVYCDGGSLVASSCNNVALNETGFSSIRGNAQDCSCGQGSQDYCMYVVGHEQDEYLLSSIMSFSQIPSNTVFCDSEYFPHDPTHPTIHNHICDKQPTFDVVLQHYDYDFGHNEPNFVPDTAPTYQVTQQALRVQIVVDTIQEVGFGNTVAQLLQEWIVQEQTKGVDFGKHVIVSGGKYWNIEALPFGDLTKIFGPTSSAGSFSYLEKAMDKAIEELGPNLSKDFPGFIILISSGRQTMGDLVNAFSGQNYVNVMAIDTSESSSDNMLAVSKVSPGGYYSHAGTNILEISKALRAFTSTFSYNAESDMSMLYSAQLTGLETSLSFPVDSSLKTIHLELFFKTSSVSDIVISVARNGMSEVTTSVRSHTMVETYHVGDAYGQWTLSIKSSAQYEVGIQVLGEKRDEANWIRLDCEIRKTLVNGEKYRSRIIAKAFSGANPIINTRVIANVNGKDIELKDGGTSDDQPDSIAGDGIYTAYLQDDEPGSAECRMTTDSESFAHPGFESDNNGFAANLRQPFCCGSHAPAPTTPGKIDNISRKSQSAFYKP